MNSAYRVEVRPKTAEKKIAVGHRSNLKAEKGTKRYDHTSELVGNQERKCKTYAEVAGGKQYLGSDIRSTCEKKKSNS